MARPRVNSEGQRELEKVDNQIKEFDDQVKSLTIDKMNTAPKADLEPQTKLSQKELEKSKDVYLKPVRTISSKEKFNEKFRDDYNFDAQYVHFTAENKEVIGETIELWSKPYPGMPAEFWKIPVNKPIWAPRYVAEQIKRCSYHVLSMENRVVDSTAEGAYYGTIKVDKVTQRLDALPVSEKKSIFMGSNAF